jgi:hypothetical protein
MKTYPSLVGLLLCLGPALGADDQKATGKTYQVPYRLTETKHVLVRAKINGKGPFNFIVDTGAPALFVSTAAAGKAGVEKNEQGWGTFDRLEIEGGVVLTKAKGRIEDPYQLTGMNGLGLAGAELHGIIGYTILARYRLGFDFTKHKMEWVALDFEPPAPEGLGEGVSMPQGLDMLGNLMKMFGQLLGRKADPEVVPRGFLGIELEDKDESVRVKSVLAMSPAAKAGLKAGDRVTEVGGKAVQTSADLLKSVAKIARGETVSLTVDRSGEEKKIEFKTGEGL